VSAPGLLIDNSAWVRLDSPAVGDGRAAEIADAIDRGDLVTSLPFLLEAGYSARSPSDYARTMEELGALPTAGLDDLAGSRALEAQEQLASISQQRLPPVDLLIAALADRHGLGVLHYDRHFDLIAGVTGQPTEWLSPRGTLDS